MANLVPYSKSSKNAIVRADKFFNVKSSKTNVNFSKPKESKDSSTNILLQIEKKVIKIDKLLKDSFALKKKQQKKSTIKEEQKEFEDREKELEKKKPKKEKGVNLPTPTKMGFLDWIKNFIAQTLLGFIAVRLIDFLPQLLKILPVIIKVTDFITDIGGKLLNGLVTFIDWGYKAYDSTKGFVKNIFGEGGVKQFEQLSGLLNKFLNLAIIAGLVAAGSGGLGKGTKPGARPTPGKGGRPKVTTSGGGGVGGPDIRNPLRQRPTVTTSGGGTGGFDIRNPLRQGPKITTSGGGTKGLLRTVRPFLKRIPLPVVGALIDFGLSVALGENPGRAAFRAIGAGILGAVGAAVGSIIPVAGNLIGGIAGGILGDAAGGALYDLFFNGKKPNIKQRKINKLAGGGKPTPSTGSGKSVGRTLKKKKKKARSLSFIPAKIKPGKSAGGEDKVQSVFPNPEKQWWDPFGLFSGKPQQQEEQPKKPTEKVANPQEFLLKSNDVLGRSDFFGPFFTLALKSVLGDKPNNLDYLKVGQGLNSWMQTVFKTGPLGFAGGGEVDAKQFFGGEDYTQVIAKSVEESVSKEVDTTIRNLKDELALKRPVGKEEMIQENIQKGTEGEGGPAGASGDKLTMARNLMRDLGLTAAQAAGIVGNMAAESGVENARPQGSRPGTKAPLKVDGVTGYGLVQWTSKGRQQALADFARSRGADLSKPLSMDIEYQFFLKEFKGAYGNVLKQIKNAADTKAASTIFMQQYEIPAGYKTEAKIMERYNMSKPIYDKLVRGEGKATEGMGTYVPNVPLGKGGQKIAGDLGDYMKANKSRVPVTGSIHRHPRHLPWSKSGHSVGSLHYEGRAIDFGGWAPSNQNSGGRDEQAPVIKSIIEWNKRNGYSPVQLIHHSPKYKNIGSYQSDHNDHVHVAYEKGGETLDGPHQALIGEKGTEYVIDADSYEATEKVAPGLFDILNYDVKDKASLIKYLPNIIASLSQYTDYENPNQEPQIVYIEVPVEVPVPIGSGSGGGNIFIGGGVNSTNNNMEQTLSQIG